MRDVSGGLDDREAGEMDVSKAVECIRCHAQMELGYVPDLREGGSSQQVWSPGVPRNSFWRGGLKLEADELLPVTTLRCPKCGYLESYALPNVTSATPLRRRFQKRKP
jgi:hypothetical protein